MNLSSIDRHDEFMMCYPNWEELPVKPVVTEKIFAIVIRDKKGYADAFINALKERKISENVIGIDFPLTENANKVFVECYRAIKAKRTEDGILALYNFSLLDIEGYTATETYDELLHKYKDHYTQCLEAVQAFVRTTDEMKFKKTVAFVTMGCSDINAPDGNFNPIGAIMVGVLKNANHEFLDMHGCFFDLEIGTSIEDASNYCVDEILGGVNRYDMPFNIAYRNGKRMTPSYVYDKTHQRIQRDNEITGNLLITGGLGDISIDVMEYLFGLDHCKLEHIFLVGRSSKTSAKVNDKLARLDKSMKANGKNIDIQYYSCDVSDEASLAEVFNDIRQRQGLQINGILHTAGTNSDASFINQSYEKLLEIAPAKVHGTHNIIKLTDAFKDEIKYIVMFSSLSALAGFAGQTNYTAVNLFIDNMAKYCRNHGRDNVMSIRLAIWENAGNFDQLFKTNMSLTNIAGGKLMETLFTALDKFSDRVYTIYPEKNFDTCDEAIYHDYAFKATFRPKNRPRQDLTMITRESLNKTAFVFNAPQTTDTETIHEILKKEVRRMLMYNENDELDELQPLSELGLDSIMMMEFRQIIKAVTNITVPLSVITLPNLTLHDMIEFLEKKSQGKTMDNSKEEADKQPSSIASRKEALKAKRAERIAKMAAKSKSNANSTHNSMEDLDNMNNYGDWFVRLDMNKSTKNTFLLFPAAGSSINMYGNWSKYLEHTTLLGVSYPGHLVRLEEKPIEDMNVLVDTIYKEIVKNVKNGNIPKDQPLYLFGHSLGALVAYEVAMMIQNEGKKGNSDLPKITALIASGSPAPIFPRPVAIRYENDKPVHFTDLVPEQYPEELTRLGGANSESLQSKQFQKLIPSIAADFILTDNYKRFTEKDHQFEIPIYDIGGNSDHIAPKDSRINWDIEVADGYPLKRMNFEGGHWFIQENLEAVIDYLKKELNI